MHRQDPKDPLQDPWSLDSLHTLQDPAGKKPRLTDQEMTGGDDFRTGPKTKLNPPKGKPTEVQLRRMVAIGLSLIEEKVMSNFLYTFGGEDRRQAVALL